MIEGNGLNAQQQFENSHPTEEGAIVSSFGSENSRKAGKWAYEKAMPDYKECVLE